VWACSIILYTSLAPWSSLLVIDRVAAAVTTAAKLSGTERQRVAWVDAVLLRF